jgi:ribosomal 50S subunit-associated protein YjgA (DUF615 family)
MTKPGPLTQDEDAGAASADLARRLASYRKRLEAEGRKRSLQLIDKAIRDAENEGVADD